MFQSKRVGRGKALNSYFAVITESAYENRIVFRAVCFLTALGLLLTVIIATVPQTAATVIRLSLGEYQAAANVQSSEAGTVYLDATGASVTTAPTMEDLDKAVRALTSDRDMLMQRGEILFTSYVTTLSEGEAQQKIDAINEEKAFMARQRAERDKNRKAAVAAATVNTGYTTYIRLNDDGVPMSQKGDVEVDDYGVPLHYKHMIVGKATAYCTGTITSTGTRPMQGTVAVNPRQIPYGSHLYITSADGSYVYGYAVAEDTGGFIYFTNGATVDLYMYSRSDCLEWGFRTANIYILD